MTNHLKSEFKILNTFLGRRGMILLTIGILWIVRGTSVSFGSSMHYDQSQSVLHTYLPENTRAFMWIVSGIIAVYYAFRKDDGPGFLLLMSMPLMQTLTYIYAFGQYLASHGNEGLSIGLSYSVVWGAVFSVIYICSGWPEPAPNQRELRDSYLAISGEDS